MRSVEEIMAEVDATLMTNSREVTQALVEELRSIGTPQAEVVALRTCGIADWRAGNFVEAVELLRQALELMEELGDRVGAAGVTGNIGLVYRSMGDYPQALEYYRRALQVQEELGDQRSAARVTLGMGNVYFQTGDYPQALRYYDRALQLQEEAGDKVSAAHTVGNVGIVYMSTGDYPKALEHYRRALDMHAEMGDRTGAASVTSNIGVVSLKMEDHPQALEYFRQGLQMHEELGNRAGVATVLGSLGNVYHRMGNLPEALEHLQRSLQMHEDMQNQDGAAIVTGNIASLLLEMNRDQEAEQLLHKQSAMKLDRPGARAEYHLNRAALAERDGKLDEARVQLQLALETASNAGDRDMEATCHKRLRDLAKKSNDFQGYVEHNDACVRITDEVRGAKVSRRLAIMDAERTMSAERQEREKERALLYGALPEHIATRMLRGESIEDHFENAAVLFLDIAGFTTHSTSMHPSETIKLLDDIFMTFDAICAEHGVVKVKTIGDSYLCFAHEGSLARARDDKSPPSSRDSDVVIPSASEERVAAVALAMRNAEFYWPTSHELRDTSSNSNRIQLRIGIHSGPVTAGVIGTQRLQYDIWGDTVNVASRMESTGEPGRIQVSSAFAMALGNGELGMGNAAKARVIPSASEEPHSLSPIPYSLRERGAIEVKGKGVMTTYWLEFATAR